MWANIKYWLKHHDYAWKYKLEVCLPLFVFLVIVDWATKIAVQFSMTQGQQIDAMPGFLTILYTINPGSAYGANAGNVGGSIAIAAVITIVTLFIITFLNDKMWLIAIIFIFSGSFANLIARSWAPAVTDPDSAYLGVKGGVIDFMIWGFNIAGSGGYIFNMADVWVNIGVILLIVFLIVEIVKFIIQAKNKNKDLEVIDETAGSQTERARGDEEDIKPTAKQKREKAKEEKVLRNNETDRKANSYEKQRELTAKEIKAQKKLEKMSKNENKSK